MIRDVATELAVPRFRGFRYRAMMYSAKACTSRLGAAAAIWRSCSPGFGSRPTIIANIGDHLHGKAAIVELDRSGVETSLVSALEGLRAHLTVIVVTPMGNERSSVIRVPAERCLLSRYWGLLDGMTPHALLVSGYSLFGAPRRTFVVGLVSKVAGFGMPVILDLPIMVALGCRMLACAGQKSHPRHPAAR